jgi:hypothetical protein
LAEIIAFVSGWLRRRLLWRVAYPPLEFSTSRRNLEAKPAGAPHGLSGLGHGLLRPEEQLLQDFPPGLEGLGPDASFFLGSRYQPVVHR